MAVSVREKTHRILVEVELSRMHRDRPEEAAKIAELIEYDNEKYWWICLRCRSYVPNDHVEDGRIHKCGGLVI